MGGRPPPAMTQGPGRRCHSTVLTLTATKPAKWRNAVACGRKCRACTAHPAAGAGSAAACQRATESKASHVAAADPCDTWRSSPWHDGSAQGSQTSWHDSCDLTMPETNSADRQQRRRTQEPSDVLAWCDEHRDLRADRAVRRVRQHLRQRREQPDGRLQARWIPISSTT